MIAHSVYRMFDADSRLLYVGCTSQFLTRIDQHRVTKAWWGEIATVNVEHFGSYAEAHAAEALAIRTEDPLHDGTRDSGKRAAATRRARRERAHAEGRCCYDCKVCAPQRYERLRARNAQMRADFARWAEEAAK